MPLSKLVPRRIVRLVRRAKMSPAGKAFVKKWDELREDCPMPLGHMIELIRNSGGRAVHEGIRSNPGILHRVLACFEREDDHREQVEIIRMLLEICPKAAGIPVPSNDDPKTLVYPLHEACYNCNTPNEVIELLLKESTAGLDHMVTMGMCDGINEWFSGIAGTPLHYYLYWGKGDIAIVKRLVEACPGALTMKDTTTRGLNPLHTVLHPPSEPDLEVVKFLVQYKPSLVQERATWGRYPIHLALINKYITVEVIEFLLERSTMSVWEMRDNEGCLPMHYLLDYGANVWDLRDDQGLLPMHSLLRNEEIEEPLAVEILRLFLRIYPNETFFREPDEFGDMPIHLAAMAGHGAEFCKLLVDVAPGCERIADASGYEPLFGARHIDTVKFLVGLYPGSIYLQSHGLTPFHYAVRRLEGKYKADILRYFLELDPSFASTAGWTFRGTENLLPLQTACIKWDYGSEDWMGAKVVKILFDYHPRAILAPDSFGNLPVDLAKEALAKEKEERHPFYEKHEKTISFLETQFPFVVGASNNDALNTPDANGMLLLHRALLEKNISLGTVKMIVEGTNHEAAVRGLNPLHLACANCAADIVQYLSGIYPSHVNGVDDQGCNILHLACKGGNLEAVQYLLEQFAPMALETNNMDLLPLHLLCDKAGKKEIIFGSDYSKNNLDYAGLVWQLLLANPAAVSSAAAHLHESS